MKKHRYGLAYLLVIILPVAGIFLAYRFVNFNLDVLLGIVLGLSFLMAGEINAEYQSKRLIWGHISDSSRNKVAFSVALIIFLCSISYPNWNWINLSFQSKMIWAIISILSGLIMFIVLATRDLRLTIFKKVFHIKQKT